LKQILLISSEFPPQPGGIGSHATDLAGALQAAGFQLTVLTNSRRDVAAELQYDLTCTFSVKRIPRYALGVGTYIHRITALLGLIFRHRYNCVISSGKFSLWMVGIAKIIFPSQYFLGAIHGTEITQKGRLSTWMTSKSLASHNHLVAVSNFTKNMILNTFGTHPITVINNGFNPEKFKFQADEINEKAGKPVLVTVGNMSLRKGQHHVISALPSLRRLFPEIHYHIIGLPTEQPKLKALAKELDVLDCITFHGALDNTSTARILKASDVFIMLSDHTTYGDVEGFGIAILEANALGLPAIGSINCGIEDAIADKFSGRLVNNRDIEAIVQALVEIQEHYQEYSQNARQWAEGFSWEKKVIAYIALIP
jgi:phosphatidylinositol alpha-1,6-mannosyltransferase